MHSRNRLYENAKLLKLEEELEARVSSLQGSAEQTKAGADCACAQSELVVVKEEIRSQKLVQSCLGFIYAG